MSQQSQPLSTTTQNRREEGFTLIELIVVITIIGILAGAVVVGTSGRDDQARVQRVKSDFAQIKTAAALFKADHRRWPDSLDELMSPPDGPNGTQPYLESEPLDPWSDQYYEFEIDSGQIILMSFGADQAQGGEGVEADIRSDELSGRDQ